MELWVPITIAAAFLQNVRSGLQKRMTGDLSVNGAAYCRFLYALPFALVAVALLYGEQPLPGMPGTFFAWVVVAGVGQILGTSALLAAFEHGNFAVGTAYSKTEVVQTAVFGLMLLGDALSARMAAGIAVSFVGVLLLSQRAGLSVLLRPGPAMLYGVAAGAGFAVAAVGFRGASISLETGAFYERALLTLGAALTVQTLVMGSYLALRERGEITRVLAAWPMATWVGLSGMVASACWFSAMTLENAASVRALGQVELVFAFAVSAWVFREAVRPREVAGVALVVAGVWLLV